MSVSMARLFTCMLLPPLNILWYWPFVRGIHRSPVDSPHKEPVMRTRCTLWCSIEQAVEWKSKCMCHDCNGGNDVNELITSCQSAWLDYLHACWCRPQTSCLQVYHWRPLSHWPIPDNDNSGRRIPNTDNVTVLIIVPRDISLLKSHKYKSTTAKPKTVVNSYALAKELLQSRAKPKIWWMTRLPKAGIYSIDR